MPLYALGNLVPQVHPTAFIHPEATIIGQVTLGAGVTIWPAVVLRGDYGAIEIGNDVAVQDGTVVHGNVAQATTVASGCIIGHLAHIEGCTIGEECLIGSGSVVMAGARVGPRAVVGAGAVVRRGTQVPEGAVALGVPARIREGARRPAALEAFKAAVRRHAQLGERYRQELRLIEAHPHPATTLHISDVPSAADPPGRSNPARRS